MWRKSLINNSVDASSERRLVSCLRRVGVVEEVIQRGLVWTFEFHVWWILRFAKLFVEKCSERRFWGFFRKFFKNIFWLVFGLFWGSKSGPPTPIRGSEFEAFGSRFWPRETLTGVSENLIPRIYGVWQTLMVIGFYEKQAFVTGVWNLAQRVKNLCIFFVCSISFSTSINQNFFATSLTRVECEKRSEMLDNGFNTCNLCVDPLN